MRVAKHSKSRWIRIVVDSGMPACDDGTTKDDCNRTDSKAGGNRRLRPIFFGSVNAFSECNPADLSTKTDVVAQSEQLSDLMS
ncbi:hypothetical protein DBIPINDM_003639 [Mesorhizobium sp. AR02]|uniref:hypothetical protein n=1 Tax=Mesorhizobium sp. AR02 TaxID=2865837 RepID=UPI00215FBF0B|nr:hypothetical protein [Mesorhizobium sp. AR02]UVK50474.1 hypothetical protein DBIPINDM_003639 [Mesorhizobium sp. AR02]